MKMSSFTKKEKRKRKCPYSPNTDGFDFTTRERERERERESTLPGGEDDWSPESGRERELYESRRGISMGC